jgi:hypothetical protein
VFQLRFRASELLYVRRQALVDRKPFSQSKKNHFLKKRCVQFPGDKAPGPRMDSPIYSSRSLSLGESLEKISERLSILR